MEQRTIIIIGAGIAGLTTAAYLARARLNVYIFEQHTQPGGYISSFTRDGFTFPAGPTSFGSNGIVFPILKELGLDDRRQFVRIHHQLSWKNCDVPLFSPAQARDALSQAFTHERRGLQRFFRWVSIEGRGFRDQIESGLMLSGGKAIFGSVLRLGLRNALFPWAKSVAGRK